MVRCSRGALEPEYKFCGELGTGSGLDTFSFFLSLCTGGGSGLPAFNRFGYLRAGVSTGDSNGVLILFDSSSTVSVHL
jgi:hypothetical protein